MLWGMDCAGSGEVFNLDSQALQAYFLANMLDDAYLHGHHIELLTDFFTNFRQLATTIALFFMIAKVVDLFDAR